MTKDEIKQSVKMSEMSMNTWAFQMVTVETYLNIWRLEILQMKKSVAWIVFSLA